MEILNIFDTDVAAERMICSQYLIRLKPSFECVARCARYSEPLPELDKTILDELLDYLYTYNRKIYITEINGDIWGFVPTLFPSSATVLALRFNVGAGVALRCLTQSKYGEMLEYSQNIKIKKSRSAKVNEAFLRIEAFLKNVKECFFEAYELNGAPEAIIQEFERLVIGFSKMTGTPVDIVKRNVAEADTTCGEVDFPLFSSFALTVLLLSREFALDRSVRMSFCMLSQSVAAVAEIRAEQEHFANSISLWENICADTVMPWGVFFKEGVLKIGIQPCRRELSYLELKQTEENWIDI